jgi:hypothetical protein
MICSHTESAGAQRGENAQGADDAGHLSRACHLFG